MDADVQQMVLVKEEAPEEQSAGVDQQDPEHLHIKEELWTSLEGEHLRLKETDVVRFQFTAVPIKSEDDEEKPLFSQLHQQQIEDRDVPTSSSADQMTAETGGGAETSRNPDLNPHEQTSDSSETEVSGDDEEEDDVTLDPELSDSGPETRDGDNGSSEGSDDCGKIISKKSNLNNHMRFHTGQKCFPCELCGQKFNQKSGLNRHMSVHTRQKPFACELCGQRFSRKTHLNRHMSVHTGQKPFACEHCEQRFSHKATLNTHIRVHTGQKPFACELCGQRFSQKTNLNTHMRVHTGQKPFACEICGQRFRDKSTINRHMSVHTGQKPFACELCGQRFSVKAHLNRHMSVHKGCKELI